MTSFRNETGALLRIYRNGGHPNISGLRDIYEDFDYFYLVMDLVSGGEMFDNLIKYGAYSEADAARLMQEVASALAFLHGVGVVHADLKPENLLLCSEKRVDGTIKLIDFGCAVLSKDKYLYDKEESEEIGSLQLVKDNNFNEIMSENSLIGTSAYFPPERFLSGKTPDPASDMWALGIILYIMLTGVHPYDLTGMANDAEIEEHIRNNSSPLIVPELSTHLSPYALDLVLNLLMADPNKRITADEMLKHPWIANEEATTEIIEKSAQKLSKFKDLRLKIEAGIFSILIENSSRDMTLSEYTPQMVYRDVGKGGDGGTYPVMSVLKRAFEVFDEAGKGFLTADDLERVINLKTGQKLSDFDKKVVLAASHNINESKSFVTGLSLSHFSKLFAGLRHKHFPRSHIIFSAGEEGDAMYFINSGKVEIQTRKGKLLHILGHGDFFGEGCLLDENNKRFSTAKCATPVDVIKIKRSDFQRYIENSKAARDTLKFRWKARLLADAKSMIRFQTNVKKCMYFRGEIVYREGDMGKSMYFVDEENGGTLKEVSAGIT